MNIFCSTFIYDFKYLILVLCCPVGLDEQSSVGGLGEVLPAAGAYVGRAAGGAGAARAGGGGRRAGAARGPARARGRAAAARRRRAARGRARALPGHYTVPSSRRTSNTCVWVSLYMRFECL